MPSEKKLNYTPEQEAEMKVVYDPSASEADRKEAVTMLAVKYGKKERSIISKLSNLDHYTAKVKVSKVTGAEPAKKIVLATNLVKQIERVTSVRGLNPETLEKANKTDLSGLIAAFSEILDIAFPEMDEDAEPEPATD